MPWFRLDESFHSHPKVIAAGNEAVGLYTRCGTYAAEHLTNGFIRDDVAMLYGANDLGTRRNPTTGKRETIAETLTRTRLWKRTRGGWRMPDYLDYNPSADQVRAERKQAAERQRRYRAVTSRATERKAPVDNSVEEQQPSSEVVMSRRDSRVSHTTPSRPGITNGSVGSQSSDRNGRANTSPQMIKAIVSEILDTTGTNITPAWAQSIADHILDGRTPDNPVAYVRHTIRNDPDPKTRFLPLY